MDVFEVVDATDDEMYFTQGIFSTYEKGLAFASTGSVPSEYAEEYAKIEIRRRPLDGYSHTGTEVCIVRWEETEDGWRAVETQELPALSATAQEE